MNMKKRKGTVYLIKLTMHTQSGDELDYKFMKVDSFVNFHSDPVKSQTQLKNQVERKIGFYEKLYSIEIVHYSWETLSSRKMEFLPAPDFLYNIRRRNAEKM